MGSWSREFDSPVIASLATNVDITDLNTAHYLNNLDVFNTLVIDAKLTNQSGSLIPYDAAAFTIILRLGGNTGTIINQYTLWLQGSWWAPVLGGGFSVGDGTQSVIPLHGADTAQIQSFTMSAQEDLTITSITGTSEVRDFAHATTVQRGYQFPGSPGNGGQELLYQRSYSYHSGDSALNIPLPVVDTPCRFFCLINPGSTQTTQGISITGSYRAAGATNGPLFIRDNLMSVNVNIGVQKVYNGTGLADQTNAPFHWFDLPHTLNPTFIAFDKPASGNTAVLDFGLITSP